MKPWDDVFSDFVVQRPECEVFHEIWVVVGRISKMRHFIPCHTVIDGIGLARLFSQEVVRVLGIPVPIRSDRGP